MLARIFSVRSVADLLRHASPANHPSLHTVITLTLWIALCVFATPGQGAEGEPNGPERWLPARLEESLAIHLEAIIEHASTRRACNTILEAKYSDSSSEQNPKFIVTCDSEEYGSTNLVYWQTDVEQNFANVRYEAKNDPLADAERINEIDLAFSKSEQQDMLLACQQAFSDNYRDHLPGLGEALVEMKLRANNTLAIYLDYPAGGATTSSAFTATCLITPGKKPRLDVFTR